LESVEKGEGIDWATAEMLSFASLLSEGHPIRLSGQDTRRGTFSHRHSVLVDTQTGKHHIPLHRLGDNQAPFYVYDSLLSEYAVLGFEYGYSLVDPRVLVIWEAQFGDFANNAQVIIDQFIVSAEVKWQRRSGLVLLLPHALEGQGPEHSSARLERFLQLCAEDNLEVCYPTTPAQYFHLLRRQVKRGFRKPLVVMSPKSLLRHPLAVSSLAELASGHFSEILDDPAAVTTPRRVVLCSGKVYYDLLERRQSISMSHSAIVRLEQLYPFNAERVKEVLSRYSGAKEWCWVQEEPRNMGGWTFVQPRLEAVIGRSLEYIGRPAAASPTTGYMSIYKEEQAAILDQAI
jgi:2-oxoglutarate dehydrogenase E1 component